MKLIIAGSRGIHDYSLVERAMRESQFPHPSEIVSGGAKGVDELGERFARDHRIKLTRKCADWAKFGKRAGILRNDEMAQYADYLIAIWDGKSAGTKHMIESAKRRGMRTFVLRV